LTGAGAYHAGKNTGAGDLVLRLFPDTILDRHRGGWPGEEAAMVYGTEKPISERTRVVIIVALWLFVGVPLFVGMWFWMGWWVLLLVAAAVWGTVDYVRRGDFFTSVDHAASHHIRRGEDGKSRFGD